MRFDGTHPGLGKRLDAEIVPINSYDIIPAAGAIHCIVKQLPSRTETAPAAHVVSPSGGELLPWGATTDLQWAATDDENVTSVDLHCSTDGGATFPHLIASGQVNDGHFQWAIGQLASQDAVVRVVAHDGDSNTGEALSEGSFNIDCLTQAVYSFQSGGGVNKWGWGNQTAGWTILDGMRRPAEVGAQLTATSYSKIATSNAAGGDTDPNRYISPIPGGTSTCCFAHATPGCNNAACQAAVCACDPFCCGAGGGVWDEFCAGTGYVPGCGAQILCSALCPGDRFSTHIFEFVINEAPASIRDIGILWEGYADDCVQMELYVWDDLQGDWGDGAGLIGENRFMDNFAGNIDAQLNGHLRNNFDDYLTGSGILTILLYGERSSEESFHDYVAVTVATDHFGDVNGSGIADLADVEAFVAVLLGTTSDPGQHCRADLDGSGDANGADSKPLVDALVSP